MMRSVRRFPVALCVLALAFCSGSGWHYGALAPQTDPFRKSAVWKPSWPASTR